MMKLRALLAIAFVSLAAATNSVAQTPTVVLLSDQRYRFTNFQVVVARASGHLAQVRSPGDLKRALTNAQGAILMLCDDVEAAVTTIRFVQQGGRAAMFCGRMTEAVRQVMLDAAGLAVTLVKGVDIYDVRFPLQEYLPIGTGPLVKIGCSITQRLSFVREPPLVARTERLKDFPRTSLGAVVAIEKGLLLLAVIDEPNIQCSPFFGDWAIEASDNEQAALVLAEWLLNKR